MFNRHLVRLLLPLLVLLVLVGCRQEPVERQVPTAPSEVIFSSPSGYDLVQDPLVRQLLATRPSISALIGVNGGSLELLGHRLEVPRGAVSIPTLFTMTVLPLYVEVDLRAAATTSGLLGRVINVGSQGFQKPIPVTLTYSRTTFATNPPGVERLSILRVTSVLGYSRYEPLPSVVDTVARTVTAELDHFSRYTMASPH